MKRERKENKFLWVVDFPMFARNPEKNQLESVHHPFTAPHPDDMEVFMNAKDDQLETVRSQAYDLVLNGQEIGGGSIRIHDRDMQHFVLEQILKIPHEHLNHLLNALESGCPPHGGIALGLDRLIAIICRARSMRDVIAFPKSLNGRDPLSNAPVPISDEEKALYHLAVIENTSKSTEHAIEDDDPDAVRATPSPEPPSDGMVVDNEDSKPVTQGIDGVTPAEHVDSIDDGEKASTQKTLIKEPPEPLNKSQLGDAPAAPAALTPAVTTKVVVKAKRSVATTVKK